MPRSYFFSRNNENVSLVTKLNIDNFMMDHKVAMLSLWMLVESISPLKQDN